MKYSDRKLLRKMTTKSLDEKTIVLSEQGISFTSAATSLEVPQIKKRAGATPRASGIQKYSTDLEVVGEKSAKFIEMWPKNALLND